MKPSALAPRRKNAYLLVSGCIGFLLCHYMSLMAQRGQLPAGPLPWTSRLALGRVLNRGLLGGLALRSSHLDGLLFWGCLIAIGVLALSFFWKHAQARADWLLLGLIMGAGLATVVDRLRFGGVNDYFLLHVSNARPALAFNLPDIILPPAVLMLSLRIAFLRGQQRDGM